MREKLLLSGIAIIASCTLSSCTFEEVLSYEPTVPTDKTEVRFSSQILKQTPSSSRINGNVWEPGDAIGIYMLEGENQAISEGKVNVRYTTEHGGHTANFVAKDNTIYFPDDGRKVRFMSYYPYSAQTSNSIYKVDVSNQIPQSKIDLLYSFDTSSTYDKNIVSRRVPIAFSHQLTKIYINVKNGEGLQGHDLAHIKVSISGLSTKADFNLLTGKLSNLTGTNPISPSVLIAEGGNVYSSEAIVIPGANISKAKITFNLKNGTVHTWNFDKVLEKGKKYTYNVTISRTGIVVDSKTHEWYNIGI